MKKRKKEIFWKIIAPIFGFHFSDNRTSRRIAWELFTRKIVGIVIIILTYKIVIPFLCNSIKIVNYSNPWNWVIIFSLAHMLWTFFYIIGILMDIYVDNKNLRIFFHLIPPVISGVGLLVNCVIIILKMQENNQQLLVSYAFPYVLILMTHSFFVFFMGLREIKRL